jgi:ABC-type transport system involved in multi-copper enzyme maturation permease subunit
MIGHLVRGAALVAGQEFRIRLRTGRWRWLLGAWVLVLAVFTALVDAALSSVHMSGPRGVPLLGILMLFVLGLVLVISPALTAQSVNGDRERGTLATLQITRLTPVQIALGKLAAGWAVGLVALALTLPFVGWAMAEGGLTIARVAGVVSVAALLMGVVCAFSQALSALLARSITSALLSYVVVFALTAGTGIAFGVLSPLVAEHRPTVGSYDETISRPDRIWWLLAPNPFVILADSAPQLPPRLIEGTDGRTYVRPDDPLSAFGQEVRRIRIPPDTASGSSAGLIGDEWAVWPYGLGFDLLLAVGAVWVTARRLRAPSHRIPRGVRVG